MRRAAIFYGIANSSTASLNKHLSNAPRWIVVLPLDGLGILVVFADVAHQLSPPGLHRGKYAAGYDITLNTPEPVLHLVQRRRVRGCEVHAHVAVLYKEVPHALGLVLSPSATASIRTDPGQSSAALSLRRLANSDHAMPASASRPIPSAPQSHHLRDGSCGAFAGTGASVAAATTACTAATGSVTEASSAAMGLSAAWPGIRVDRARGAPRAGPCPAPLPATALQARETGAPPCARNTSVRGVAPTAMVGGVAPSTLTGPEVRSRRREYTAPSSASAGERASPPACARRYTTVSSSGASPGPLGSGFVRRCWCRNA